MTYTDSIPQMCVISYLSGTTPLTSTASANPVNYL